MSTGGMSVAWALLSADPLCNGGAPTGRISGAVNTVIIGFDAMFTPVFGAVLDLFWDGATDPEGTRTYGQSAYCIGFLVCACVMSMSVLCVLVLYLQMRRAGLMCNGM